MEDQYFDANQTIGCVSFCKTAIDIGPQGMKWHSSLTIPFRSRHFGTTQASTTVYANALGAELHRRCHTLLHGPSEGDTSLQLLSDIFCYELSINLRFTDFKDINDHLTLRDAIEILLEFFNLGAFFPDNDPGARCVDIYLGLIGRPFDFYSGDTGVVKLLLEVFLILRSS
jgi:hypothetical protein